MYRRQSPSPTLNFNNLNFKHNRKTWFSPKTNEEILISFVVIFGVAIAVGIVLICLYFENVPLITGPTTAPTGPTTVPTNLATEFAEFKTKTDTALSSLSNKTQRLDENGQGNELVLTSKGKKVLSYDNSYGVFDNDIFLYGKLVYAAITDPNLKDGIDPRPKWPSQQDIEMAKGGTGTDTGLDPGEIAGIVIGSLSLVAIIIIIIYIAKPGLFKRTT